MATGIVTAACILAAAGKYQVPPAILHAILKVEGGQVGTVSRNTNGSQDLGPMQINTIWIEELSGRYRIDQKRTRENLINNGCFNVDAGAYILAKNISEAKNFWLGVSYYHSRTRHHGARYLAAVVKEYKRHLGQTHAVSGGTVTTGPRVPAAIAETQTAAAEPERLPGLKVIKPRGVRARRPIEERLGIVRPAAAARRPAAN